MIVKIEAYHDGEFWCARGIGEDIFTQGETFDELIENIKEVSRMGNAHPTKPYIRKE